MFAQLIHTESPYKVLYDLHLGYLLDLSYHFPNTHYTPAMSNLWLSLSHTKHAPLLLSPKMTTTPSE